jgi:hypothetical protein
MMRIARLLRTVGSKTPQAKGGATDTLIRPWHRVDKVVVNLRRIVGAVRVWGEKGRGPFMSRDDGHTHPDARAPKRRSPLAK